MKKIANKIKNNFSPLMIVIGFVLLLYTLMLISLLVWASYTSLKDVLDYSIDKVGIPSIKDLKFSNYLTVFKYFTAEDKTVRPARTVFIWEMLANSLLYAVGSAFMQATIQFIMAYLAARFNFKFGKIVYGLVIVGMIIPIVGSQPSALAIAELLNLKDSIWGMWIMKSYFLGMYFLIFFETLKAFPKDFSEAAYIDGASNTRVMFQIIAPLTKTMYFTIVLLLFVQFWNDYTTPMLFMPNKPTLSYGLYRFVVENKIDEIAYDPYKMGACLMLLIPIIVIFTIFHDKLLSNVTLGGVKE